MKKIYTIGRDEGCDIVVPDNSDVISRLHATIRVESGDKIYITDQSRNGTYVNGMRISSNVEVPVSRKDVISLAHIVDFDWSLIPKQRSKYLNILIGLALLVIVGIVAYFVFKPNKPTPQPTPTPKQHTEVIPDSPQPDSIANKDTIEVKHEEPVKVRTPRKEKEKDTVKTEKTNEEIYNPVY